MARSSTLPAIAAAIANLAVAIAKFIAFAFTGSSAMLTEAFHSIADTGNQCLLVVGNKLSAKPPDARHPFGYGMDQYFWSFVVAILIFALGGAFSIYEGVHRLLAPEPIRDAWISFVVIGSALVFEGASFLITRREYQKGADGALSFAGLKRSKDPALFTVLLEDGAALAGLLIAAAGIAGSALLGWRQADGVASICIGLLLVSVATFLARETRSLLIGESASPAVVARIRELVDATDGVRLVQDVFTLHLGPDRILAAISLHIEAATDGAATRVLFADLSKAARTADSRIQYVFFSPIAGTPSFLQDGEVEQPATAHLVKDSSEGQW